MASGARSVVERISTPTARAAPDGYRAYPILTQFGYSHEVESTARGMEQDAVLRHYHRAVANLKTWIKGTFHGRIEGEHLQGYLNEFAFRFNRRHNLFAAFQAMIGIAREVERPTRNTLYVIAPGTVRLRPTPHRVAMV